MTEILTLPVDTPFEASVFGWPTGIAAELGVRILDSLGNETVPRLTPPVEVPSGSGRYAVTLTTPHDPGEYTIMWDRGNVVSPGTTTYEPLIVSGGFVTTDTLPGEIMASLGDIQTYLDNNVTPATPENTALLQVSASRVIRGYLSRVISNEVLLSWSTPDTTPPIIRTIAGMLIAAHLYYNYISGQSSEISDIHYAKRLYDEAIALLNGIIDGSIIIEDVPIDDTSSMSLLDGWPVDATDRPFSMGMNL